MRREGIDIGAPIEVNPRIAKYNSKYTPERYRALCYLDRWTEENLSRQVHDILTACPWSEEEISELNCIHVKKEAEVAPRVKQRREYIESKHQGWRRRVSGQMDEMVREE